MVFEKLFKQFFTAKEIGRKKTRFYNTTNQYEFEMYAVRAWDDNWYAIVINPDLSRCNHIDNEIWEEFGAHIVCWRVTLKSQKTLHKKIINPPIEHRPMTDEEWKAVTTDYGASFAWLIQITRPDFDYKFYDD